MWNPDVYIETLLNNVSKQQKQFVENCASHQQLPFQLIEALGGFPNHKADLDPQLLERVERADYFQERVMYTTDTDLRVPAYVLIPKHCKGKTPAVVAWHGHGYGSREVIGLNPDGAFKDGDPGIHKRFAVELVMRGLIVLVPETVGFGDRRLRADMAKDPAKSSSCFALATKLLLIGKTLAGLRVYEAIRAVDYLISRGDVDTNRIGCMGFSGGGLVSALSAALDHRIRATVLSAYASTFQGSIMSISHCIDNYIPGILTVAELPDLIGLIAPRALFIESGTNDPLFPTESVKTAVKQLSDIYRNCDSLDKFHSDLFPGGHEVCGRVSFDWLLHQLVK